MENAKMNEVLAEQISNIIGMNLTAYGVNVSKLLDEQRKKITRLNEVNTAVNKNNRQLADHLLEARRELAVMKPGSCKAAEPVSTCKPDAPTKSAEPADGGVDVHITVTGQGPMPAKLAAMLDDFVEMLQSVARK